jgi:archaemetzincin
MIAHEISHEFKQSVHFIENHINLNEYYNPTRRQYNANKLLKPIDLVSYPQVTKKIGLFKVDLFIPILTYIFGQAVFNGNTGMASLYRLSNEHYGLKKDEALLLQRFAKVVIHELGHTFGLIHCHVPSCVMQSSTYVEDIDQKSQNLCIKCQAKIGLSTH